MHTVTNQQDWEFLVNGGEAYEAFDAYLNDFGPVYETQLDERTFSALKDVVQRKCLQPIMADQYASENRHGGDDLVALADNVVKAMTSGLAVVTWYGDDAECLIAAYDRRVLNVVAGVSA